MKTFSIIFGYLKWHYGQALISLSKVWGNFLYFILDFFSLKLLLKNFFDPWKKLNENYPKNFNFKKYLYTFLTNLIVRLVGIIMRTFLILLGITSCLLLILLYPLSLIGWLFLPFIVFCLIFYGLFLIIF
ncbi:MAG: hypothetical protein A2541_02835 [Candidatus Taylorbacteria bacterium RIFOXYD2_FULL_36_9]|uniref:Uncharacterized protein n=1 Tax=Candidatus Taylorbacteria bacterium RIFOXYD2_FULL_36_9 TaxID=1802338 RepID=A0A1G2PE91_9BACT|nr:MAG: hypothetical protein A2541_02835 [Candidatus Taylorbacteria bacterium RIFOXYD2_FULL_36_9]